MQFDLANIDFFFYRIWMNVFSTLSIFRKFRIFGEEFALLVSMVVTALYGKLKITSNKAIDLFFSVLRLRAGRF
jgi:hypothetical protein